MDISSIKINEKMKKWSEALRSYELPAWNELPELNLYMDQVIILMNKYLKIYCENPEEDKLITPSIINNYVKLKVIPSPIKKKYSKIHLAYLIMVCILKQCLSISTIKNIIPLTEDEEKIKNIYEIFCRNSKSALEEVADKITSSENETLYEAVLKSALNAGIYKLLTEKTAAEFDEL